MAARKLEILWQRVTVGAETCQRCGDTGESVRRAVALLRAELAPRGIEVALTERTLPPLLPGVLDESNRVFFNGVPLEELLGAQNGKSHCPSCCDLLGEQMNGQTDCRTLLVDGCEFEALPEEVLVRAGRMAAEQLK
jgi:hypothetical protein